MARDSWAYGTVTLGCTTTIGVELFAMFTYSLVRLFGLATMTPALNAPLPPPLTVALILAALVLTRPSTSCPSAKRLPKGKDSRGRSPRWRAAGRLTAARLTAQRRLGRAHWVRTSYYYYIRRCSKASNETTRYFTKAPSQSKFAPDLYQRLPGPYMGPQPPLAVPWSWNSRANPCLSPKSGRSTSS